MTREEQIREAALSWHSEWMINNNQYDNKRNKQSPQRTYARA